MNTLQNPSEPNKSKFLTPDQAAELLQVCRRTVIRRIEDNTIRAKKFGDKWRIPTTEMDRLASLG